MIKMPSGSIFTSDQLLHASDDEVLSLVVDYYQHCLMDNEHANAWLDQRKLYVPEVLAQLMIGFSDRSLGKLIPSNRTAKGKKIRRQLADAGIYKVSGHETHVGGITVPLIDVSGKVVNLYSHKISNRLRPGTPIEVYSNGQEGVFNLNRLVGSTELILTGSILDALSFVACGFFNSTCLLDYSEDAAKYVDLCSRIGCQRVLLAFPDDPGARAWVDEYTNTFLMAGIDCYRIKLTKDLSVNQYICSIPNVNEGLGQLIRTAEWLGQPSDSDEIEHSEALLPNKRELEEYFDESESLDELDDLEELGELDDLDALEMNDEGELEALPAVRLPEPPPEQKIKEEDHCSATIRMTG